MTLLDRFRTPSRHNHPDPAVRLLHVAEIPVDDREAIAAVARGDEDARVRRAAVVKLMDPAALGFIAREDRDAAVRDAAADMLRDIALDEFEGTAEADSLDAVDALEDAKLLVHIAKHAPRDIVALRALSRVSDGRALGSIARRAVCEAARFGALGALRERADRAQLVAVALSGECNDTALAAVELVEDRTELELIASRGKNRSAAKRARSLLRAREEQTVPEATGERSDVSVDVSVETKTAMYPAGLPIESVVGPSLVPEPDGRDDVAHEAVPELAHSGAPPSFAEEETPRPFDAEPVPPALSQHRADDLAQSESARREDRLAELAEVAARAAADPDLAAARTRLSVAKREWSVLVEGAAVDPVVSSRFEDAQTRIAARQIEAEESELRARRWSLTQLSRLLGRVESLQAQPDLSLKAAERALHDVRKALSAVPPLPTQQDVDEMTRRLRAVQATLAPKIQELRSVEDWKRWANVAVQEQLVGRMEALAALEDPEALAKEVRTLQQQWRQAADVPRAQTEVLWRRFKAAHDAVWPRCEGHFAALARARADNLARKIALCERAEGLAESTRWVETAEELKRLQAEWKGIGVASGGGERAAWERFRAACDRFFSRRQADLSERKKAWTENLAKKEALSARAEALADSTDWDRAAAELKRLQADWKTVGPVKRNRSEAIWQRFHSACNRFFTRYATRFEAARAERLAACEAICADLEAVEPPVDHGETSATPPPGLLAKVREARGRWQRELQAQAGDPDRARTLQSRFAAALSRVLSDWPAAFAGTELDADANRRRMESLVVRLERLAAAHGEDAESGRDQDVPPATRLAAMLKEALAANTIGGKIDEESKWRGLADEVHRAEADWARIGFVPDNDRRGLAERFDLVCQRIAARLGRVAATPPTGGAPAKAAGMGKSREARKAP